DGNDALIALTSEGRYRVTLKGIQALPDDGSLKKYLDAANMKKMADTRIRYSAEFSKEAITRPFTAYSSANIVYRDKENIMWVGGDFGIVACDMSYPLKKEKPQVYLREITIMSDSILWGGYMQKDLRPISTMDNIEIPADCHTMTVRYSVAKNSVFSPAKYRYRINGGNWTAWSSETMARFNNMPYGPTLLEIEAQDLNGNISDAAKVSWFHQLPLYLRWWAILCYIFIIIMIIRGLVRWRMKNVEKAKIALERIVKERTKDLKNALDEKERMQADMVRMERNATAGKLTQGLIDRILNPINYINNFSKLTNDLAKDLSEDIEDEKENMSEDGYEDCMDILDMMHQNLGKIEEHGVNTTHTLRAMEAMLNNNIGTPRDTNISTLCQQAADVTKEYHKMDITTDIASDIHANIDPESINKALLSLLSNAVYAVNKKAKKAQYKPEVKLSLKPVDNNVEIRIYDNGIGIEDTILDKVYDPFFTTKTTGEGTGVGLFLTREIIQAHGGTITLNSVKDDHTEFLITLKKL
ncbi:MAG: HAMP domain-containing histidine kinase, partial [Prevotella sp.]|nr:HAMP domain-containing histidine kinase [Prevotella sp.]